MQNWNQWQLPAGGVTTAMPQPPVGYAAPGADPMAMMQAYMQYYNQPAPSGYTAEQWAAAQQQNWAHWQQWQQQYQQWQAQYGDKYQETMKQLSAQGMAMPGQAPPLPSVQPPPLPKEDAKPPLPPNTYQFTSMPPPHQNNLPLFPAKQAASGIAPQTNVPNYPQNPPLPSAQPPLPPEMTDAKESASTTKRSATGSVSESSSAKKLKVEDDELTEAEKTFDAQFKQWEEQFNKWKQQNANHPDKTQYKQYEAKWTSWREKLIERREQMRKKREQQKQAAAKMDAEKSKNLPGGDKIMNILSSTENQGLINNLLGIGKTLGLTGKQSSNAPPPPPPPPPPETTEATSSTTGCATPQANAPSNMMAPNPWTPAQWPTQYNPSGFPGFQSITGVPPPSFNMGQMPNFAQPPPNLASSTPNFSQPPPGFPPNDAGQLQNSRLPAAQDRLPYGAMDKGAFGQNDRPASDISHFGGNSGPGQGPVDNNFRGNDKCGAKGMGSDFFGRDAYPKGTDLPFRPNDSFTPRNESFDRKDDVGPDGDFRRDDRNFMDRGSGQFNQKGNFNPGDRFGPGNDRFGNSDRFAPGDRFGSGNDRFGPGGDRFGSSNDRFASGSNERFAAGDRFGPGERFNPDNDRFGVNNDRFGPGNRFVPPPDRMGANFDRFSSGSDRFAPNSDRFPPGNERFESSDRFGTTDRFGSGNDQSGANERFPRSNADHYDQKDSADNRRDSFGNNPRFGRNQFDHPPDELAPELKKLMEKRRAAMDVFKPSFLDSEKGASGFSSLSESFKKIAGESPFLRPSGDLNQRGNLGPRGIPFGGPGNFRGPPGIDFKGPRGPGDMGPRGPHEFGPRGPGGFGPRGGGPFDIPDGPNFRGKSNFGRNDDQRVTRDFDMRQNPPDINADSGASMVCPEDTTSTEKDNAHSSKGPANDKALESDTQKLEQDGQNTSQQNFPPQRDIPPLEKPAWMNTQFPGDNPLETEESRLQKESSATPDVQAKNCDEKPDSISETEDPSKKTEMLPFMGENDPKPEDLNMEPPPELPNLGPIPTEINTEPPFGLTQKADNQTKSDPQMPFAPGSEGRFPIFGPRGPFNIPPNNSGPEPNETPLGPRGLSDGQFGPRGPNRQFGPGRSEDNMPFGPRAPNDVPFNTRGSNDGPFGPCSPNDVPFAPRGPNSGPFGPRGPNDSRELLDGPRGPNDRGFGPQGPSGPFGSRGPSDSSFAPRGPSDGSFGLQRPKDGPFGFRGPNDRPFGLPPGPDGPFGPRGPMDGLFAPKHSSFGPRDFDRPFAPRESNEEYCGPPGRRGQLGPNDGLFSRGPDGTMRSRNDASFNRPQFDPASSADFRTRGPFDGGAGSRPPMDATFGTLPSDKSSDAESLLGRGDSQLDKTDKLDNTGKDSGFSQNCFGDVDQRLGLDPNLEKRGSSEAEKNFVGFERRSPYKSGDKTGDSSTSSSIRSGFGESSDYGKFSGSNMFMKRQERQSRSRQEFCIERQYNYNHGGGTVEKKFIEHIPAKVIDYAHNSRPVCHDHLTPAQCFDYGHGNLKPVVPEHELYPQKDFRDWEDNEQNLKEYAEKMKRYEGFMSRGTSRRSVDRNQMRSADRLDDRKYDRRDRESYKDKERSHEEKSSDNRFEKDQDDRLQSDRTGGKDGPSERCEQSRRGDAGKENEKDDDRSKGNINWQESSNKNAIDTKTQDISVPGKQQHNVLDTPPKTLELGKTPNCTMVDDLLCPPGRQNRPPKIAIILRGPPGSGKSFVAKLIKDKEVEQGGSAPRILSLDDYFLVEKEIESQDDNGKKVTVKEMVYEYEEAMEPSYITSLVKAFKKNITDGFFNFIILDCINEKISDYEEMWSFAKSKGFKVYVCEMEMDVQICLKRNVHNRCEDEINRIIDYFEPTPGYHQKLDVNSMLQEQAIEEVHMEDSQEAQDKAPQPSEDSQDSQEDASETIGVSKWERMEADDKLDRLDGLAKRKNEGKPQTMEDFLQVPDYYNMEDTSGKKRVRWADLEERKEQEKMRAVGFVVGHTNWDRMMDPTKGGSALTRTKYI